MKIFLAVLAVIILLICALLALRVSIRIIYNGKFKYVLKAGPVKLNRFIEGGKKKKKKTKKKTRTELTSEKTDSPKEKTPVSEIIGLVIDLVKAFVSKFFGHVTVKCARAVVIIGGDDPAKTAVTYGIAVQSVAYLTEILRRNTKFKPKSGADMRVTVDFTREKSSADIDITLSVSLWGVLCTGLHTAIAYIKRQNSK